MAAPCSNRPLIQGTKGKRTSSVLQANAANTVKTALTHVVSDQAGTAHNLAIDGHTIAAKTGTAELKQKAKTLTAKKMAFGRHGC